jgi:hypothetical protein
MDHFELNCTEINNLPRNSKGVTVMAFRWQVCVNKYDATVRKDVDNVQTHSSVSSLSWEPDQDICNFFNPFIVQNPKFMEFPLSLSFKLCQINISTLRARLQHLGPAGKSTSKQASHLSGLRLLNWSWSGNQWVGMDARWGHLCVHFRLCEHCELTAILLQNIYHLCKNELTVR